MQKYSTTLRCIKNSVGRIERFLEHKEYRKLLILFRYRLEILQSFFRRLLRYSYADIRIEINVSIPEKFTHK